MRIRLTEAQAWETLARFFGGRRQDFNVAAGLCKQIQNLRLERWITWWVYDRMFPRIQRTALWRKSADGYMWPRTIEGAQARARFCWRQVKRLRGR